MKSEAFKNKIEEDVNLLKVFFKSGDNIWLTRALRDPMARSFKREVLRVIVKQVEFITPDRIAHITKRLTKMNIEYYEILRALLSAMGFGTILNVESIDNFLEWAGKQGGKAAHEKIGIGTTFELTDPNLIRQLKERRDYLIDSVDRTTKEWIVDQISSGVEEGLTNQEIADLLHKKIKDIAQYRAEMIVHAETSNAMNIVEHKEFQNNGVTRKRWTTSNDDRVTLGCQRNQGEGWVDMNYRYGREQILYPPRFPLCRCYIVPDLQTRTRNGIQF